MCVGSILHERSSDGTCKAVGMWQPHFSAACIHMYLQYIQNVFVCEESLSTLDCMRNIVEGNLSGVNSSSKKIDATEEARYVLSSWNVMVKLKYHGQVEISWSSWDIMVKLRYHGLVEISWSNWYLKLILICYFSWTGEREQLTAALRQVKQGWDTAWPSSSQGAITKLL